MGIKEGDCTKEPKPFDGVDPDDMIMKTDCFWCGAVYEFKDHTMCPECGTDINCRGV